MTTAQLFISSARASFADLGPLIKKAWTLFVFAFLLTLACSELFLEMSRMAGQNELVHFMSQIGLLLCALLESAILIMIVPHLVFGATDPVWPLFFTNNRVYLLDLVIEGLRVLVVVLLWALALILPGLWMQIRLSFVPLTVLLDKRYQDQNLDPLKESKALTQGMTWVLVIFTIVFYAIDFLLESIIRKYDILIDPVIPLVLGVASFMLQVWWMAFITRIYLLRSKALLDLNHPQEKPWH